MKQIDVRLKAQNPRRPSKMQHIQLVNLLEEKGRRMTMGQKNLKKGNVTIAKNLGISLKTVGRREEVPKVKDPREREKEKRLQQKPRIRREVTQMPCGW